MSARNPVSIIIPSRDRLGHLARTLTALRLQTRRDFEVIVVSNTTDAARGLRHADRAVVAPFEAANVAAARNAGLAIASGDIVAFCDDDAVPEPTWLARLCDPFGDASVGAAGGLVIGRNGVSVQWGAAEVGRDGFDTRLDIRQTTVFAPARRAAIKTPGTNMAFRRAALEEVGGFDEGFRYFLDEADLNVRLNTTAWKTAYVPGARVNHGFAASAQRHANRVPRDLTQIGASRALFCARHLNADPAPILEGARLAQRRRLLAMMQIGVLEPSRIAPLLRSFDAGVALAARRNSHIPAIARGSGGPVYCDGPAPEHVTLHARLFTRNARHRRARAAAEHGKCVTLIEVLPSMRMTTATFTDGGYWHHRLGQFGRTDRADNLHRLRWNRQAYNDEVARISAFRGP